MSQSDADHTPRERPCGLGSRRGGSTAVVYNGAMRTGWIGVGVAAAAMMLGGCADHVSKSEAKDSWRATQKAMASVGLGGGFSFSAAGMVTPEGASGVVQGAVDCVDGGSIEAIAEGEVTENSIDSSFEVEFNECTTDGITLDGALSYDMHIDEEAFTADFAGDLVLSGEAKGHCVIDGHIEVGLNKLLLVREGDICGFKWEKIRD